MPAFPPALLGYRHVGDERYFGKPGVSPVRRSLNPFLKVWLTMVGLIALLRTGKLLNISDHSMALYVGKLAAWAQVNIAETDQRRAATADPEIAKRV